MSEFLKYREKGSKEILLLSVTDDYGNSVAVTNLSEQHQEFLYHAADWHEVTNDAAMPVFRVPAKAFDFKARGTTEQPGSVSRPAPRIETARRDEDKFNIPLKCSLSGIPLGKFVPSVGLAVATPYVTAWKQTAFLHPVFSLKLSEVLHRSEACWNLEKTGTRTFPTQHKQLLFLAMLHASGCIKQDVPALPSPKITETFFMQVFEILTWKYEMATDRVSFPRLHIWKGAAKEDAFELFAGISAWLEACKSAKEDYENISRGRQNAAKAKARELALKSIKRQMYGDVSLRRVWNWILAQVPQSIIENNPDLEQLFFAEEQAIHNWQQEDIEALEDLLLTHCETGNSVSFEFSKRIRQLADWRKTYFDTFEVEIDTAEQFKAFTGTPEPRPQDFPSRAAYLVASAKWRLGNKPANPTNTDKEEL